MKRTAFSIWLVLWTYASMNGQAPPVSVFTVDVDATGYSIDEIDRSKIARDVTGTVAVPIANFNQFVTVGDVVEVNGIRAKGVLVGSGMILMLRPEATPGQAIADVMRGSFSNYYLEILQENGTPVGTLNMTGFFGGSPPPGSPRSATAANWTIIGGTGAFLGARGQVTLTTRPTRPALRAQAEASIREDPSLRRVHQPSRADRLLIMLIPMNAPEIRAVYHADFSPVTEANPARRGEAVVSVATGLGPTRPGVDPNTPFPPFQISLVEQVNSPIEVTVGGKPAEAWNKIGWPGTKDMYRVDFRIPGDASGEAIVQLSAAWIKGSEFRVPVR